MRSQYSFILALSIESQTVNEIIPLGLVFIIIFIYWCNPLYRSLMTTVRASPQ